MGYLHRTNTWRGRVQPKRDPCPKCGKRGLGPVKAHDIRIIDKPGGCTMLVGQHCRYCLHWTNL